jgi:hypothetical protein
MRDNIWAWIAQALPRRLVMQCIIRARVMQFLKYDSGDRRRNSAEQLINLWREVVNGKTEERR